MSNINSTLIFKRTVTFFFLLIYSLHGLSQTKEDIKQLEEIRVQARDAIKSRNQEELKALRLKYLEIISRSKSFVSFTIGYEFCKANIKRLNSDLLSKGFPLMKDKLSAIAFGYSRMNKKTAGNLLFNVITGNKVSSTDYEISLRGAGVTFDKGYAFIYSENCILHAFVGIGGQYHTVKETKKSNNPSGVSLYDLKPEASTGKITQNTFHGSLGLQLDLTVDYNKSKNSGLIAGIRFAYNPVITKGKYKYGENDSEYKPIIDWRQYNISIMVKQFSKTYFKRKIRL